MGSNQLLSRYMFIILCTDYGSKDYLHTFVYILLCVLLVHALAYVTWYYSMFTFSWPRFESGSLRNG